MHRNEVEDAYALGGCFEPVAEGGMIDLIDSGGLRHAPWKSCVMGRLHPVNEDANARALTAVLVNHSQTL